MDDFHQVTGRGFNLVFSKKYNAAVGGDMHENVKRPAPERGWHQSAPVRDQNMDQFRTTQEAAGIVRYIGLTGANGF